MPAQTPLEDLRAVGGYDGWLSWVKMPAQIPLDWLGVVGGYDEWLRWVKMPTQTPLDCVCAVLGFSLVREIRRRSKKIRRDFGGMGCSGLGRYQRRTSLN